MAALAYNPFVQGIGLDEDTAAFIGPDNVVRVVGAGAVTIVDVNDLEYSSMAYASEGEPVELIGVRLHVLAHGGRYSLSRRKASPAWTTIVFETHNSLDSTFKGCVSVY